MANSSTWCRNRVRGGKSSLARLLDERLTKLQSAVPAVEKTQRDVAATLAAVEGTCTDIAATRDEVEASSTDLTATRQDVASARTALDALSTRLDSTCDRIDAAREESRRTVQESLDATRRAP